MLCPVDLHECEREFDCEDLGCRQIHIYPEPRTSPFENLRAPSLVEGNLEPAAPAHRGGYSGEEQE